MKNIITICILTILLATHVSAFGVSSSYYEEKPLILNPGQTKEIILTLQNEKTSSPVTIQAELSSDIAIITGKTTFDLKTGETDVPINIRVKIPEEAKIGDTYNFGVAFSKITEPGLQPPTKVQA